MFNVGSEDDKLQCPYDISHSVTRKHYQIHLLRCKKNHPEIEVVKCPLNAIHVMPEADLLNHLSVCSDRKLISQYHGPIVNENRHEEVKHDPSVDEGENWDDDDNKSVPDFIPTVFSALQFKREK